MQTSDVRISGPYGPVEYNYTVTAFFSFDLGNQVYSFGWYSFTGIINLKAVFHGTRCCFIQVYTE